MSNERINPALNTYRRKTTARLNTGANTPTNTNLKTAPKIATGRTPTSQPPAVASKPPARKRKCGATPPRRSARLARFTEPEAEAEPVCPRAPRKPAAAGPAGPAAAGDRATASGDRWLERDPLRTPRQPVDSDSDSDNDNDKDKDAGGWLVVNGDYRPPVDSHSDSDDDDDDDAAAPAENDNSDSAVDRRTAQRIAQARAQATPHYRLHCHSCHCGGDPLCPAYIPSSP